MYFYDTFLILSFSWNQNTILICFYNTMLYDTADYIIVSIFKNTFIIMTSNLITDVDKNANVMDILRGFFKPEFLNACPAFRRNECKIPAHFRKAGGSGYF